MRVKASWLSVGIVLVTLAPVGGGRAVPRLHAQQPKSPTEPVTSSTEIKVTSNLVNVMFSVTDKKSHMVMNLDRADIQVLEDSKPQAISFFSRETDLPLRIGILIDTSNSIRERLHFEQEAANDFLGSTLRPGKDKAFVVAFDVEPQMVQDYTDDVDKLAEAVRGVQAGGGTGLYDAIYFASKEKMLIFPPPEPYLRRVMIVVSDGIDNESQHSRDEALGMAQRGEVTIYAISTNRSGTALRARSSPLRPRTWARTSRKFPASCAPSTAWATSPQTARMTAPFAPSRLWPGGETFPSAPNRATSPPHSNRVLGSPYIS
ncbi:MAG: VWA domain-containing protein [Acidobacteria bacterium]|nr:MAG: VWA domain-containing protein [Acidobacteriota bacterium]